MPRGRWLSGVQERQVNNMVGRGDAVLLRLGKRLGYTVAEICQMVNNEPTPRRPRVRKITPG